MYLWCPHSNVHHHATSNLSRSSKVRGGACVKVTGTLGFGARPMSSLSFGEICLRLLSAYGAGFVVGWEREHHGRPAGLRTNILACVAAAMAMVVSELLFTQSAASVPSDAWRPDPARLAAGVLTGIGFLGVGTILRHGNFVRGVTTAASLWFATVLGLVFGAGQFRLGAIGFALALIALLVLPRFEKHIRSDWHAEVLVTANLEALTELDLRQRITALGPEVKGMRLTYALELKERMICCELKLKKSRALELSSRVVAELARCPGVVRVSWT